MIQACSKCDSVPKELLKEKICNKNLALFNFDHFDLTLALSARNSLKCFDL